MRSLLQIAFAILFLSLLCKAAWFGEDNNNDKIELTADEAKDFNKPLSRARRGLHHECYNEGCTWEEVEEVLGNGQQAREYWYTYRCNKFRQNCKVMCAYRKDCSFGDWGHWAPAIKTNQPGCYSQKRFQPYRHMTQVTYRREGCQGLQTSCPSNPMEQRLMCVCKQADCKAGDWSAWSGSPQQGECVTQSREKPFMATYSYPQVVGSCVGIVERCNAPTVDLRRMCSCKRVTCTLDDWSGWQGTPNDNQCATQRRTRTYSAKVSYEVRSDCSGIPSSCPAEKAETRELCSCRYAKCSLGEWSGWEPKSLDQGSCGQSQTRRKRYALSWAYQNHVGLCLTLPQKCPDDVTESRQQCMCAYRDSCDMNDWTSWSEDVTSEGCKVQVRIRTYVSPLKHMQKAQCEGLNQCINEPQETRTYCKCKTVQCKLGEWSEWSGADITSGSCNEQTRTKAYTSTEAFTDKLDTCNDVPTACPADKKESRRMCKCNLVTCQVGEWGTWQGDISADSCGTQTRSKAVSSTHAHKYQENTCEGLATTCPDTPTESRKMCNCSYREDCSLLEWQGWQGDIPESGCARQIRHREYNNSIIYVQRDTCDGLTSCPVIKDETRTKCNCNKIICEWSNWFRESFDQETNCWTEMRVKNASSGFEKVVQMDNCNAIPSMCDMGLVERQKDCQSGGGGHTIITSPTPLPTVATVAPTTAFVPATFVQVGCFNDDQGSSKRKGVRPLPHLFKNLRDQITDWFNFDHILQGCANEARNLRYEYFGVQFFAECWGGKDPEGNEAYARDGLAAESKCWKGVGGQRTNMVYRVQDMPGCSDELDFTSIVSSGVGLAGKMPDRVWLGLC
ncbi:SCO-spondin isoform X3 [Nematostella vectensis]|uniref:SCO-spondin isoform X3 n=1 Tax=Nematostella vectensis TaxID=45351 RepID=UPI002076F32B|nr:SCO-spondin isoform X3 [Nematostella vectensis]